MNLGDKLMLMLRGGAIMGLIFSIYRTAISKDTGLMWISIGLLFLLVLVNIVDLYEERI